MTSSSSFIACALILLAGASHAESDTTRSTSQLAAAATPTDRSKPADAGRLRTADISAQRMAEHAEAVAERGQAAIGDWSQRTTQLIVRLAHKADEAAREAASRWKVEAEAARGEAREEILRAQQEVANAAVATGEALERAKEMAQTDVQKGKEAAEKSAVAAREAFDKAERATGVAAKAARDAANKALKRTHGG